MPRPLLPRPVPGLLLLLVPLSGCVDAEAPEPEPCVLVVTAAGWTDADPAVTPVRTELLERAVRFDHAWLPTGDLHANGVALWSSREPRHTGVTDGDGALPADVPGLLEPVYARDLWTGAVVSVAELANAGGMERGFERYDGQLLEDPAAALHVASARLAERNARPGGWFLWVHLPGSDPAALDAALGALLEAVEASGRGPRTTVVVADLLGVPDGPGRRGLLAVRRPELPPHRCREDVSLLDVVPTLTEVLELPREDELPADGHSLAAALFGLDVGRPPVIVQGAAGPLAIEDGWSLDAAGTVEALRSHGAEAPAPELRTRLEHALHGPPPEADAEAGGADAPPSAPAQGEPPVSDEQE